MCVCVYVCVHGVCGVCRFRCIKLLTLTESGAVGAAYIAAVSIGATIALDYSKTTRPLATIEL